MRRLLLIVAIAATMLAAVPLTAEAGTAAVNCNEDGPCIVTAAVNLTCPAGKARVFRLRAKMDSKALVDPTYPFLTNARKYDYRRVQADSNYTDALNVSGYWLATADTKWHTLQSVWESGHVSQVSGQVDWLYADSGWWGELNRKIFVWWGNCRIQPL